MKALAINMRVKCRPLYLSPKATRLPNFGSHVFPGLPLGGGLGGEVGPAKAVAAGREAARNCILSFLSTLYER